MTAFRLFKPPPASKKAIFLLLGLFAYASPLCARIRIIIDTDAGCGLADQFALAYALLSPEIFQIEGITAVHDGPGTLERNFLEIHQVIGMAGASGIPVVRGADRPLNSVKEPVDSPAARFIIERSKAAGAGELVVLGTGPATNLASAILLDPSIKNRVTFAWAGGTKWPDGKGGEPNSRLDLAAQRVLFTTGVKLKFIPCGNNRLVQNRAASARNLRGISPLGDYLHLLMAANRGTSREEFDILDLTAIAAIAHPELAHWLTAPAPWVFDDGDYDTGCTYWPMDVAAGLVESPDSAPAPLWDEFYRKVREAAPAGESVREELCRVLNVHPNPPDVQPVEGPPEKFSGFTRQEVTWPTIFGEYVPAYVCKPANAGAKKLPAMICLSGTSGDRILLTSEFYGIADYVSIGQKEPHEMLHGWASELARRGYLTLAMTQRGLGDRGRTGDNQSKAALIRGFTSQGIHTHEIRQALTYLSRRPDVDSQRIGCTGMSFGGITTFYTTAVDPRFKVAAPLCGGVGSLRQMIEIGTPGYHGVYWWVPRILLHFDQGELVAAQAPRPYFIAAPLDDIGMPREAVQELLDKALPAYRQAGRPEALVAYRPPGEHAFTLEMFEELVKFLDKYL